MKSIDVRLSNTPILQKTAKKNIVRHPGKLSNISKILRTVLQGHLKLSLT